MYLLPGRGRGSESDLLINVNINLFFNEEIQKICK